MRAAISLPESLLHAADAFAERAGMSRSELFRAAVTDYLEAHKHDHVREALDAVYADQPWSTTTILAAPVASPEYDAPIAVKRRFRLAGRASG